MAQVTDEKKIIFSMSRVNRTFPPGKQVLRDVSLGFYLGAKIGVLGLNGAGKSTLLRVIAGKDTEYHGDITFSKGYSVGMFEQEPDIDPNITVKEAISQGVAPVLKLLKDFEDISMKLADPMSDEEMEKALNRQSTLQEQLDATGAWEIDAKISQASDALNCPPDDQLIGTLSGGEKRRVALCKLLLEAPDVLLLDEPTNHLDAASVFFLQRHLRDYKGTVIAVTHDRYFLDEVCEWILELDRGHGIPWQGNYSSWLGQKQKRLEQEEKTESKRQRTMAKELEWIGESASARRTKSKSRIARYEQMLNETQDKREEELEIYIPPGPRLGTTVIQAKNVTKAFGDKLLFENLEFSLPQGGIVGIIGPNGAGKTTLFKMIMGEEKPDSGEFNVGETVQLGYVKQERMSKSDTRPLWEALGDGQEMIKLGTKDVAARAYAARFGFTGNDQQKSVSVLSGGERNRIQLAMVLKDAGNVLLLDEPTNDLDINTLRALEEALSNFAGCAVVISHDRWFLDRIATHIMAFEGEAKVVWFEGNYSDYMEDRKRRLGGKAEEFGRLKYKKLVR